MTAAATFQNLPHSHWWAWRCWALVLHVARDPGTDTFGGQKWRQQRAESSARFIFMGATDLWR